MFDMNYEHRRVTKLNAEHRVPMPHHGGRVYKSEKVYSYSTNQFLRRSCNVDQIVRKPRKR